MEEKFNELLKRVINSSDSMESFEKNLLKNGFEYFYGKNDSVINLIYYFSDGRKSNLSWCVNDLKDTFKNINIK